MMNKSLIEWCDFTWNPVTGCQHGCLYCYAAKQANRFSGNVLINKTSEQLRKEWDERGTRWVLKKPFKNEIGKVTPFPVKFEPMFREYCLPMPAQKKKPAVIFVVSMGDLFGEWVPDEWIRRVFGAAQAAPWHTYLFLTKNPQRYIQLAEAGKLPQQKNFWYGTTVTRPDQQYAWFEPGTYNWFLSIEPIQEDFTFDASWVIRSETKGTYAPPWIIVGAETGQQKNKTIPQAEWVQHILEFSQAHGSKVFLKIIWPLILLGIWCRISHLVIPLRIWDNVDKSINIMGERGNTPPGQAGEHENYGKNGLRYGSHVYDGFL